MSPRGIEAELRIRAVEQASGKIEDDLAKRALPKWGDEFQEQINKLNLSPRKLEEVRRSWERMRQEMTQTGRGAAHYFATMNDWRARTLGHLRQVQQGYEQVARARQLAGLARDMGAGYAAQRVLRTGAEKAGEYVREETRQYLAGMTPAEQKEAEHKSRELSAKYPSVGQAAVMEHIRLLRGRFGDFHHAMEQVEALVQAQVVL